MQLLVSIVGPTATGKTKFTLQLIKVLEKSLKDINGFDVISADSRQVYKGMEIGTGVDLPIDPAEKFSTTQFYGISTLQPIEAWSLAQFLEFAEEKIQAAWAAKRLPIVIGGTGLYHQHVFHHSADVHAQPDSEIRTRAEELSIEELQNWLQKIALSKWELMNSSDRQNPRRLIRAIEAATMPVRMNKEPASSQPKPDFFHLTIGLTDELKNLQEKIHARVLERLNNGMLSEVQNLMANYTDEQWKKLPAFSATGYKEVRAYLEDQLTKDQMIELWSRREFQYAKRQLTWWKKYGVVPDNESKKYEATHWFQVNKPNWQEEAISAILQKYEEIL